MYHKRKAESTRQSMVAAAFVGWQIGKSKKIFTEYLKGFGLQENEEISGNVKSSIEEDRETYRRIVQKLNKSEAKK